MKRSKVVEKENLNDVNLFADEMRRSDDVSYFVVDVPIVKFCHWCSHSRCFPSVFLFADVSDHRKNIDFMVALNFGYGF